MSAYDLGIHGDSIYLAAPSGVYRRQKDVFAWESISTGLPECAPLGAVAGKNFGATWLLGEYQGTLYAGCTDVGVYQLDDKEKKWLPFKSGLPEKIDIFRLYSHGGNFYLAGSPNGVYRWQPLAKTWVPLGPFTFSDGSKVPSAIMTVYDLQTYQGNLYTGGMNLGVFRLGCPSK